MCVCTHFLDFVEWLMFFLRDFKGNWGMVDRVDNCGLVKI